MTETLALATETLTPDMSNVSIPAKFWSAAELKHAFVVVFCYMHRKESRFAISVCNCIHHTSLLTLILVMFHMLLKRNLRTCA